MKKVFTLLFSWLYFFDTQAQVTIAYCKIDGGCKFYQTQYSYKDVDNMLGYMGVFERDKGIMTFFKNKQGQDIHYPDKKRNPRELHEYFGGKGEPNIAKGGIILPFDKTIQPKDGNWIAQTDKPILKNCPSQLGTQTDNIASIKSGNKVFSKPFKPTDLLPNTKWLTLAENNYRVAILNDTQTAFKTFYTVNVLSPVQITGIADIYVTIPNQKTCEIKINFTYTTK